ncbi:MAG: hypothetical protein BalsKO_09470 [Balneolaceae bacterium]
MTKTGKRLFLLFASSILLIGIVACDISNKGDTDETDDIPREVVFSMVDDSENENHQIYVMDINGANLKQLTFFENEEALQPSWSPDGTQIVFTTSLESSSLGLSIFLMNADGTNIRPMKTFTNPSFDFVQPGSHPKWSPDGTKITFQWCVNCEICGRNTEIFIYDFLTDSVSQITNNLAEDIYPIWDRTNESSLAFLSNREYIAIDSLKKTKDLFMAHLNDKSIEKISNVGSSANPVWTEPNKFVFRSTNSTSFFIELNTNTMNMHELSTLFIKDAIHYPISYNPVLDELLVYSYGLTQPHLNSVGMINLENDEYREIFRKFRSNANPLIEGLDWFYTSN